FYRDLGLRQVHEPRANDGIAELEMRGGTHLVLVLDTDARTDGRVAPFDLMADDLDALHDKIEAGGAEVSAIERGGHASFTFRDPRPCAPPNRPRARRASVRDPTRDAYSRARACGT